MNEKLKKILLISVINLISVNEISSEIMDLTESFTKTLSFITDEHQYLSNYNEPVYIAGLPNARPEGPEEMPEVKAYLCGYIHYCYNIITVVIIALDSKSAHSKAEMFKQKIDSRAKNEHPNSGAFKMHLTEEEQTSEDLLKLSGNANSFTII